MQDAIKNYEDVDSWKTVIFLYNAALKEVGTLISVARYYHIVGMQSYR